MIPRSRAIVKLLGFCVLAVLACAPEDDPVSTGQPPRDPDGAAVKRVVVLPDAIDVLSYPQAVDFQISSRVLFGSWEGVHATTLIRFDPAAFVEFEGDSLAGSIVFDGELSYNCPGDQGPDGTIPVTVRGVAESWNADSLLWPGPALLADSLVTPLATCPADSFFERTINIPGTVIESWIADPDGNHGLAVNGGEGAMLQMASRENNFLLPGAVSDPEVQGPRLRFRARRPQGDTTAVFLAASSIEVDTQVFSPDEAVLPCPEPDDCVVLGRGVVHRLIVHSELPDLPLGSDVHRVSLSLAVTGHPRFDRDLTLLVYRLTSVWPDGVPVDSLENVVETSGVIWHQTELAADSTQVDVPVTELVQSWYDGVHENRGFLVRLFSEGADVAAVAFAGPDHPDPALRPTIEITYTVPYGGRP